MIPGTYHFTVYEGETWAETWTRSGVTTASGWAAKLDIRSGEDESSTLYLGLTSSSGIALSSDGVKLIMAVTITAAQTIALGLLNFTMAHYDLKLTHPDATAEYLLRGTVFLRQRITP